MLGLLWNVFLGGRVIISFVSIRLDFLRDYGRFYFFGISFGTGRDGLEIIRIRWWFLGKVVVKLC